MSRRHLAAVRRPCAPRAVLRSAIGPISKAISAAGLGEFRVTGFEALEPRRVLSATLEPQFELFSQGGATPLASASPVGYTPAQIRHAYGFDQVLFSGGIVGDGSGQTIAIIDAYHTPTIQSDLHSFDVAFGLPDPPHFTQVAQDGSQNFPTVDPLGPGAPQGNWELETALDVEWAHALAPGASILLVEANSPFFSDLVQSSVDYARHQPGVVAVSMSFGSDEFPNETSFDQYFTTPVRARQYYISGRDRRSWPPGRLSGVFVERGGRGRHHVVGRCGGQLRERIGLERQRRQCEHHDSAAVVPNRRGDAKHHTSSQSGCCLRCRSHHRRGGVRFVQLRNRHTVDSGWRNESFFAGLGLDHRRRRSGAGDRRARLARRRYANVAAAVSTAGRRF